MIETKNLHKNFQDIKALIDINASIKDGYVFGLIGTNGAGKSTFLKTVAGILKPDMGQVLIDGEEVFENIAIKEKFFYISDDQYFLPNATPKDCMDFYTSVYKNFDTVQFQKWMQAFDLAMNRKINTFSKGMKKQLCILLGLSANTKYILCDETFDGLDPVMRQAVKSLFASAMEERGLTPVIASHNLRELEDICDHVGLLHKGGILLSKDISDMKLGIHKIQIVFQEDFHMDLLQELSIVSKKQSGSIHTLTVKGEASDIEYKLRGWNPIFYEMLPLSLEEIFINETEVCGYDIKKLIF